MSKFIHDAKQTSTQPLELPPNTTKPEIRINTLWIAEPSQSMMAFSALLMLEVAA